MYWFQIILNISIDKSTPVRIGEAKEKKMRTDELGTKQKYYEEKTI